MENDPKSPELTPEERLFKIIQETERSGKEDTLVVSSAKIENSEFLTEQNFDKIPARSVSEPEPLRRPSFKIKIGRPTIPVVNKVLGASLMLMMAYLLVYQVIPKKSMKIEPAVPSAGRSAGFEDARNLFALESVGQASQSIAARNVFRPYAPPPPPDPSQMAAADAKSSQPTGQLATVLANLRISGIFLGDAPEALVEVKDERKTYILPIGGEIRKIKVKDIRSDSIVFTDGQNDQVLQ